MPLYVFTCPACNLEIEEKRPVALADEPLACPICGTPCVRGLTSALLLGRRPAQAPNLPARPAHRAGCGCCTPLRR